MTQNQINFAKLKEEQRHNLVTEGQGYSSLAEDLRHNKANESIGWYTGASTVRLNESRAAYQDKQTDEFYANLIANSKNPEALIAWLVVEGLIDANEEWLKNWRHGNSNPYNQGPSDNYYYNPTEK